MVNGTVERTFQLASCTRCAGVPDTLIDVWGEIVEKSLSVAAEAAAQRFRAIVDPATDADLTEARLTRSERLVFRLLRSAAPRTVSRDELMMALDYRGTGRGPLDIHVMRLRKKLKVRGYRIASIRGRGYRMTDWPTAALLAQP